MSTVLDELGIDPAITPVILVNAPDAVMAQLGRAKPRPSFASTLLTAEPTPRIVWWPEASALTQPLLSRLRWMLQSAAGEGWLVFDPDDEEPLSANAVREALAPLAMAGRFERTLSSGEVAVHVAP